MIKTIDDFKKFVGNDGKFFSVKFLKKDNTERTMVARLGVKCYTSGGSLKYKPEDRNNIIVFSTKDQAYRTINIDRLISVKAYGKKITLT
jgi:hypothetical protein